jgi:predicted MFS family arabinose efflux permease
MRAEGVEAARPADGPGPTAVPPAAAPAPRQPLPARFWQYAGTIALLSCGVASFPLLAYHAQTTGLLTDAQVPVLFAVAMVIDGLAGLVVGRLYDRRGPFVLLGVPVAAALSVVAFSNDALWVWLGVAVWGLVHGILDSTVKAVVTELVPTGSRALAFGWLAFVRGMGLLVAGAVLGAAYDAGLGVLVPLVVGANTVAFVNLGVVLRRLPR